MAITRVGHTTGVSNTGGTPSIVIPSGTADEDLIIICQSGWFAAELVVPVGWGELFRTVSDGVVSKVLWTFADSAVNFTTSRIGSGNINWICASYRGVGAISGRGAAVSHDPPEVRAAGQTGNVFIAGFANRPGTLPTSIPTGYSDRVQTSLVSDQQYVEICHKVVTATTEDPSAYVSTNTNNRVNTFTLALSEATSGGSGTAGFTGIRGVSGRLGT